MVHVVGIVKNTMLINFCQLYNQHTANSCTKLQDQIKTAQYLKLLAGNMFNINHDSFCNFCFRLKMIA